MVKRLIVVASAFAVSALALAQQTFTFGRSYKVGDIDRYSVDATFEGSSASGMTFTVLEKVTRVYRNGDADIKTSLVDFETSLGPAKGGVLPSYSSPQTSRVNRFGEAASARSEAPAQFALSLMAATGLHGKIEVSETLTFDLPDASDSKFHAKGTTRLVEIKSGIAKCHVVLNYTEKAVKGANHFEGDFWLAVATSKLISMEGKYTSDDADGPNFKLVVARKD